MNIGFRAYIDESGDEGFKFETPGQGSSRWFVLSAVITKEEHDLSAVKLVDRVRRRLNKYPRAVLHFRKMKHEHRLPFVDEIAKAPLRTISVLIHKPSLREPEKFMAQPHLLYRYATRYLLERVSWLCRDQRRDPTHLAKILFSNRSCMSYASMRTYLQHLKDHTGDFGAQIDWSVIDPSRIEAHTHDSLMGLQIADAVATSLYMACELSPQGFNESRYAVMLKPVLYRKYHRVIGYGLKFWPRDATSCGEPHFSWLREM